MIPDIYAAFSSFAQSFEGDLPRNGGRAVTSAELDAHLRPMRDDIRRLVDDQSAFAEFMSGAINSRAIQEKVHKSRQFWMGSAITLAGIAVSALGLLLKLHGG